MKKIKIAMVSLTAIILTMVFSGAVLFASDMFYDEEHLASNVEKGGVERNVIKSNSVVLDNAYRDNAVFMPGKGDMGIGAGLSGYYTDYLVMVNLPVSYSLQGIIGMDLKINVNVPYIGRGAEITGKSYSTSGLGDITAGATYQMLFGDMTTIFDVAVSFPTGDSHVTDGSVYLPLGTGG